MITRANRKIKTQIFKSTKFFNCYIILINTSNDSRCTSFLKRRKKKKKARNKKKRMEKSVKSIKLYINQQAIPVQQNQNERNCPGDRFYQVIISTN